MAARLRKGGNVAIQMATPSVLGNNLVNEFFDLRTSVTIDL